MWGASHTQFGYLRIDDDMRCILIFRWCLVTLHWRHNDHDGVSNHQPHGCLLSRLFRHRSKKTSKLRVAGLCVGNSPGPVNSRTKGQLRGKCFHLMTSSWIIPYTFWWKTSDIYEGCDWNKTCFPQHWSRNWLVVSSCSTVFVDINSICPSV